MRCYSISSHFSRINISYFLGSDILFYGLRDEKHEGANIPFNFEMISNVNDTSTAAQYKATIDAWLDRLPEGKQANWVVSSFSQIKI